MTLGKVRHLPVIDNDKLEGIVSIGRSGEAPAQREELEANVLLRVVAHAGLSVCEKHIAHCQSPCGNRRFWACCPCH